MSDKCKGDERCEAVCFYTLDGATSFTEPTGNHSAMMALRREDWSCPPLGTHTKISGNQVYRTLARGQDGSPV